MAHGFKLSGRQRGTPNKTTHEVLAAASEKMEVLGKPVTVESALELVQSVYRDSDLPLQVRLHAANIAIAREAPPSSGAVHEVFWRGCDSPASIGVAHGLVVTDRTKPTST
jgi:hypothetical protein